VYANGCASVIDVQWAVDSFGIDHTVDVAVRIRPWDMEIGQRLWSIHGPKAFRKVAHLNSVFSTCGDRGSTEVDRLELLLSHKVVIAHQIKSNIRNP
jgi:hypothetical protein